mmetsp:Transcript_3194/g.10348  ORF Transcript_3194/g.10348 Transcript_3194/m.10348 type:complete len:254 (-) Transcript_3194:641-1402(-)
MRVFARRSVCAGGGGPADEGAVLLHYLGGVQDAPLQEEARRRRQSVHHLALRELAHVAERPVALPDVLDLQLQPPHVADVAARGEDRVQVRPLGVHLEELHVDGQARDQGAQRHLRDDAHADLGDAAAVREGHGAGVEGAERAALPRRGRVEGRQASLRSDRHRQQPHAPRDGGGLPPQPGRVLRIRGRQRLEADDQGRRLREDAVGELRQHAGADVYQDGGDALRKEQHPVRAQLGHGAEVQLHTAHLERAR